MRLFGGRIHAQRVDAGGAALHLHLAPMDAGLVVQKLARQKQACLPPVQPQVVAGKAHEHGPHAEVEPAGRNQRSHARVHHGVASTTLAPGGEAGVVEVVLAQAVAYTGKVAKLNAGLVFKLLHEMAVPAQPPCKAAQRIGQCAVGCVANGHFGGLVHGAHRQAAKGQMRAQAATAFFGAQGARECLAVVVAAHLQKTLEHVPCGFLAGRLQGFAVWCQPQAGQCG